jgi:uncharacterized lipoprotein YmbA
VRRLMRSHCHCIAPVLCAIVLAGLVGCASRPDTRFYVLTPLPLVERPGDAPSSHSPMIGLRRVSLPEHLDRPEIVTRVGENMLQLAEFDQWGSPLRENLTRVLAADLSSALQVDRVAVFPWGRATPIEYEVTVEVARFEGTLGASCSLVAHWAILGRDGRESIAGGNSSHTESAGDSYATLVAAQDRLVAALGRDIATALKTIPQ